MTSAKKSKFHRIVFDLHQSSNCCGIGELGGFERDYGSTDWFSGKRKPGKSFKSQEAQFKDFSVQFKKELKGHIDSHYGDKKITRPFGIVRCSLVTKGWEEDYEEDMDDYGQGAASEEQIPGFVDYLLSQGWTKDYEFVNPKTDHTVVALCYVCPE